MFLFVTLASPFVVQASPVVIPSSAPEVELTCHIEERGGTRFLFVAGTVEERGFGEGYLLADDILVCFTEFALPYVTGGAPATWDALVRPGVQLRFTFGDDTLEWAEAIVDGMEAAHGGPVHVDVLDRAIDEWDVLAWSTVPDLSGCACSSLAVWGNESASGDVLIGRNLDYSSSPLMEGLSMIEVHAPMPSTDDSPARAGWVGVSWPGTFGCLTGLSEHGVFVAIHDVYSSAPLMGAKCTPRMLALSEIVEQARPSAGMAEEVVERLSEMTFAMGGNFMLGWQSAVGVEAPDRGAAIIEIGTEDSASEWPSAVLRSARAGEQAVACSNDHFKREGEEPGCDRYRGLIEGAAAARASEPSDVGGPGRDSAIGSAVNSGINSAKLWQLVKEAGMSITLYRCVADLGAGSLAVERHTEDGWRPRVEVDVAELLEAAATPKVSPSASGISPKNQKLAPGPK